MVQPRACHQWQVFQSHSSRAGSLKSSRITSFDPRAGLRSESPTSPAAITAALTPRISTVSPSALRIILEPHRSLDQTAGAPVRPRQRQALEPVLEVGDRARTELLLESR